MPKGMVAEQMVYNPLRMSAENPIPAVVLDELFTFN